MNSSVQTPPAGPIGIAVLGSTGSIGTQTLDVIAHHPESFRAVTLAARHARPLLNQQIDQFAPVLVAVSEKIDSKVNVLHGVDGLIAAATHPDVDIVVVATSGHDAILPTIAAIKAGKTIALANKEVLVCAGALIMPLAEARGIQIRPIDSEHSAIWQSLGSHGTDEVSRLILTASGGPFRNLTAAELEDVSPSAALAHPTWRMGNKVTIDSATMMNKGLEVIEAHWLFGLPFDQIEVLVHPESVVHSIVEFVDGSQVAQMGLPDMRLPIQYALSWPRHLSSPMPRLDLAATNGLHFELPDESRFPALALAYAVGIAGGTFPTVLSAADEIAVAAFLQGAIRFTSIVEIAKEVLAVHERAELTSVEQIKSADAWARQRAGELTRQCRHAPR